MVHPENHPMINGIIILFLIGLGILGILLLILGLVLLRKQSRKSGLYFLFIGIIIILFPVCNWGNYYRICWVEENKFVGEYVNTEQNIFVNLKSNRKWNSNYDLLKCPDGTWKYTMTEDMNYLELYCSGQENWFLQIYKCDGTFLEFRADQNLSGNDPIIRFEKY